MPSTYESEWPAQKPPPDFSERVARALLESQAESQLEPWTARASRPRRRLPFLLLAAVGISASAWGALQVGQHLSPAELSSSGEADAPLKPLEEVRVVPALPALSTQPALEPPPASLRRAPPRPPAAREPEPATEAASRPLPRVPRCECGPGGIICSCVEPSNEPGDVP